jgi:hypothetical protein
VADKPTDTTPESGEDAKFDDPAWLSLSRQDRKKLNMDSWEPSLLRKMLRAQDRLKKPE